MTAPEVAARLGARPTGPGRWQARCPAHEDHRPSLAIREGAGGRTLVRCWGGCSTAAVLGAAGLTWRDVCGAPAATPADRARLRGEREQRHHAATAARRRDTARIDALRECDGALDALAARLAAVTWCGAPGDSDALAAQYHAAIGAVRDLEVADHAA